MRRCPSTLTAGAFLGLQFLSGVTVAGPVEQLVQATLHPTDPDVMAVRYVNGGTGLLVTRDGGKVWKLSCGDAMFGALRTSGGPILLTGDGTLSTGVFKGLLHDDGHGCSWTTVPAYDGLWVADLAVDPDDPRVAYAVTSSGGEQNGLLRRDANGNWSDLGTKEEILVSDLHVVRHGSGRRFYLGAVRTPAAQDDGGTSPPINVVRVSDDDGKTWREHSYGISNGKLKVQAVDPNNPDRIVISIGHQELETAPATSTRDQVLISDDEGATSRQYLVVTDIGAVALAPDGRVWIGDAGSPFDNTQPRGLWFATSLDKPAKRLPKGDYSVQCLTYRAATDTLFACQPVAFGSVDTDGSLQASLEFTEVTDFVSCAGVDMPAVCEYQLCGAWCGFGHFAQAPLCCAYDTPICGPATAPPGTASCPKGAGGADAGSGTGGAGMGEGGAGESSGGAPSGNGGASVDASLTDDDAGPLSGKRKAGSGCDCSIGNAVNATRPGTSTALLVAALWARRRYRRRRAQGRLTSRCSSRR